MTSYQRLFLLVLVFLTTIALTDAATFSINPVADSFVTTGPSGNLSGNNYGAAGLLSVAASGKPQGEFQSVMRFDLAAARNAFDAQFGAGQWALQSIMLQLTAALSNNAIFNTPSAGQFNISWMQNDSWIEGTGQPNTPTTDGITWDTLPTFLSGNDEALGTFAYNGATSGSTTYTFTLTSGLTADLFGGGLASLRFFSADPNISYLFNSRNFATAGSRPLLTIDAVPEPGSCALVLAGLASLAGWRLRRH